MTKHRTTHCVSWLFVVTSCLCLRDTQIKGDEVEANV